MLEDMYKTLNIKLTIILFKQGRTVEYLTI